MSEFFAMSGYGQYVWSSLALTLAIIVLNVYLARRSLANARQQAKRRLAATSELTQRPAAAVSEGIT
ncbi:MAG TPA: heme exporter protein CcmD [Steroidobacteraceae bacterium]|nr:heme exporter protein CcmD [Steroidobacteraceae bacterium]HRX88807.1 heme exporter protein CcmD [Steroidobacteraceae bacterium]